MGSISRRKLITTGVAAAAGVSGIAIAARLADRYGLIAPDPGGIYGPGRVLTYGAQRILTRNSFAREFAPGQISERPVANGAIPKDPEFKRMEAGGFADWRLSVSGLVSNPATFSLSEIKAFPARGQITQLICEEGWSYVAEWIGVPLSLVLNIAGILPEAKYVVYFSVQRYWIGSIDMNDAMHPQTLLTYSMNGDSLPVGNGGPLRLRVPRQLGYKSVKYINRIAVTDSLKEFDPGGEYSWYAGI